MNECKTVKTWEKTKLNNLVRHKSGRYYARLFAGGKEIWKSLKTDHFSVAEGKLAELQKQNRERRAKETDTTSAKMTFGQGATLVLQRMTDDPGLKRRTKTYKNEVHAALLKSWPELEATEIRKVKPADCQAWESRYRKAFSATRFNGTLSFLRSVFDVAVESGVIYSNPARVVKRSKVRSKVPTLPSREQFGLFIAEMRAGHSRDSKHCADLAEGLAFTGCRISEANEIAWGDVNFHLGMLTVKGDPEEATKNGEIRTLPLIPAARALFERMRKDRKKEPATTKVFLVRECQKSMDRAAKKVGMARLTHHSLRHFFVTTAIQSRCDIPTIAGWVGHKDGGALLMRTYSHLLHSHSVAQAALVSFDPTPAANVIQFEPEAAAV